MHIFSQVRHTSQRVRMHILVCTLQVNLVPVHTIHYHCALVCITRTYGEKRG